MVDSVEHLDLIAAAVGDVARADPRLPGLRRVVLDGRRARKIGAKRSPIHTPEQARRLPRRSWHARASRSSG